MIEKRKLQQLNGRETTRNKSWRVDMNQDSQLLHYGQKGMKWKKKKVGEHQVDIDYHNLAAQQRALQNAALANEQNPQPSAPVSPYQNSATARRAEQLAMLSDSSSTKSAKITTEKFKKIVDKRKKVEAKVDSALKKTIKSRKQTKTKSKVKTSATIKAAKVKLAKRKLRIAKANKAAKLKSYKIKMANTKSKIKTLKSARSSKKGPTISFHISAAKRRSEQAAASRAFINKTSAISKARVTAMKRKVQSVM